MKTLFAGPFIGEFGFELFGWQSYIRAMSRKFDRTIVCSRPENAYLYEDFCDEFVPFDPGSYNCSGWDCYNYNHTGNVHNVNNPEKYIYKEQIHKKYDPDKVVFADTLKTGLQLMRNPQEFFRYGDDNFDSDIDLVVHARKIETGPKTKIERDWPLEEWKALILELKDRGFKIASIGLEGFAYHLPDTENLLGVNMKLLANTIGNSKIIVGPSSGPIHFATLCGCPQLTWGEKHLRKKYETEWNPFKTPVYLYGKNVWRPSAEEVVKKFDSFYNGIRIDEK